MKKIYFEDFMRMESKIILIDGDYRIVTREGIATINSDNTVLIRSLDEFKGGKQ